MKTMSSSTVEPTELLDLKLLPAWVKESAEPGSYAHYTGEEEHGPRDGRRASRDKRDRKFKGSTPINREQASNSDKSRAGAQPAFGRRGDLRRGKRPTFNKADARKPRKVARDRRARRRMDHREDGRPLVTRTPLEITIRFLPNSRVFENVVAQIKS